MDGDVGMVIELKGDFKAYEGPWEDISDLSRYSKRALREFAPKTGLRDRIARRVAGYDGSLSSEFLRGLEVPKRGQSFEDYRASYFIDKDIPLGIKQFSSVRDSGASLSWGSVLSYGEMVEIMATQMNVLQNGGRASEFLELNPADAFVSTLQLKEDSLSMGLSGTGPYKKTALEVGHKIEEKARDLDMRIFKSRKQYGY
ncbi:MAG: hypothetical protein JW727_00535 [Candidatus Aenigmarchaeota archaeon]|nr:hypothetical protein [Candidatus Aenigmarchaeota archaeon]